MISSGSHPSIEHINKFMSTVYLHQPCAVTLFNINYRTQLDRSTIKGLRIGLRSWRSPPQKNIILVSGLPLQDPSAISVNLYLAAMLSRINPMFPCDVSVIPLAHPKEYEKRWRKMPGLTAPSLFPPSSSPSSPLLSSPSCEASFSSESIIPENVNIELRDTCRPIEAYVTRRNRYYVNIEVGMNAHGSTTQYKSNSLNNLMSKGKKINPSLHELESKSHPEPYPTPLGIYGKDSILFPMLSAPTYVLELHSNHALNDDQIVARGEEVAAMMNKLITE